MTLESGFTVFLADGGTVAAADMGALRLYVDRVGRAAGRFAGGGRRDAAAHPRSGATGASFALPVGTGLGRQRDQHHGE